MKIAGDKKIILPITFLLLITLCITIFTIAGTTTNTSSPENSTMYTLTDIYNLIHADLLYGPAAPGSHNIYPSSAPTATSSYSVSQLYADLANLIKRENVATDTVYLGVTGAYGTPDPAYATTTIITSSLTPTVPLGDPIGYSLEDIWNLIDPDNSATTTPGSHDSSPSGSPAPSMHSLFDIYQALISLGNEKAPLVRKNTWYLGTIGTYDPCLDNVDGFNAGDGSVNNPYQICSWTQLANVKNHLSANFILNKDLSSADLDFLNIGDPWIPIGNCGADNSCMGGGDNQPFTGVFDGNNKTISDIYAESMGDGVGLFGYSTGNILNLNLRTITIHGVNQTGGLVGWETGGTIQNSSADGNIEGTGVDIGGLVGRFESNGTILSSYSLANVIGERYVGGLTGYSDGTITNSYSTGNTSAENNVGGLVGFQTGGIIDKSYSSGDVDGNEYIGGLVGYQQGGTIWYSHSEEATVSGVYRVGGLVGYSDGIGSNISNSYSTNNVIGTEVDIGGFIGGHFGGLITNSYATGDVTGTADDNYHVGGFAGIVAGSISTSYSTGEVRGGNSVGGFAGFASGLISQSFWDINTSYQATSAGGDGIMGTTTEVMQTPSTFTDAGWLDSNWKLISGEYPALQ